MASLTLRKKDRHIRKGELPTAAARPLEGLSSAMDNSPHLRKANRIQIKTLEVMVILKYKKPSPLCSVQGGSLS